MRNKILLSFAVFIAGLCSIIYELLVSTTATYFLGDGVRQFSIIIGVYLFSMGIGAFLSKYLATLHIRFFVHVEFLLGFIGGISVPLLYFLFVQVSPLTLQILCLAIIFVIGLLTGMEVPLLTFAFDGVDVKNDLSNVLSLDYIGGLLATLIFPFILLPFVGLYYSSLIFGILNIVLGLVISFKFLDFSKKTFAFGITALIGLLVLVGYGGKLLKVWDNAIYKSPIVLNEQTPYQKIVVTKKQEDVRLYLNRVIQFSSLDEHRYHESLVHISLGAHKNPKNVLILGGGENLASREVLKHNTIEKIDVVDIDSTMFFLAKKNPIFKKINKDAAVHPKVNLITADAFSYLANTTAVYDVIIADLPDPVNEAIARLYSRQFFLLAKSKMAKDGVFVTQAGEIYFSNTVFSCINTTLKEVFVNTHAYHAYIPSFGDWGFVMAAEHALPLKEVPDKFPKDNRFLNATQYSSMFNLPLDLEVVQTKVNTMDSPVILNYYLDDWAKWKTDLQQGTP